MTDFEEGQIAQTPEQAEQLQAQGYTKCHNQLCDWWISPAAAQQVSESGQRYTCPRCHLSYDLNTVVGQFPRESPTQFTPGGRTIAGISLEEQAQIGENLVEKLGQIPGYGPITWWHHGGAIAASPLDGATERYGIEVKTINADAQHLRFWPGSQTVRATKNADAANRGLIGTLGILVLLNYRTGKADMYLREFPLGEWDNGRGRTVTGIAPFRHHTATQFVAEVPFNNPLIDPKNPAPNVYGTELGGNYQDDQTFGNDEIPF